MTDLSDRTFNRILVSAIHGLGDALFCTPAIRALRARYPDSHLAFQVQRAFAPLFATDPHLDEIVTYDPGGLRAIWRQIRKLQAEKFDLAILFDAGMRSTYLTWLAGIPTRVGYHGRDDQGFVSNQYIRWMLSESVPLGDTQGVHRIDSHLRLVSRLGCQGGDSTYAVYLTPADHERGQELLAQAGVPAQRPLVILHPGGDWPLRRWPAERFAELANQLATDGAILAVVVGPGDSSVVKTILDSAPDTAYVPTPTVRDLACVLVHADLFVGNNSGPMHLAGALDRPLVGLHGPSRPAVHGPHTATAQCHVIYHKLPCSPCAQFHATRPLPCQKDQTHWCMAQISVQEVCDKVRPVLCSRHTPAAR